jgi:hypothetical protein
MSIFPVDEDTAQELSPLHAVGIESISCSSPSDVELGSGKSLVIKYGLIGRKREQALIGLRARLDCPFQQSLPYP